MQNELSSRDLIYFTPINNNNLLTRKSDKRVDLMSSYQIYKDILFSSNKRANNTAFSVITLGLF